MARIILVTIGSLGDLHPFIAVALALKSLGHTPVMAVPANHVEKCRVAGLETHAVFPSYDTLAQEIGDDAETITRNVMKSPDYLVREIMLRSLADSAAKIDALAVSADLIITSMFALAAPIIAQKRNIPLVPLLLQPLAILSASAPSIMPNLPLFARGSPGTIGQSWNRLLIKLMRKEMLRRFGKPMNVVRHAYGVDAAKAAPMFELEGNIPLQIATYDPVFAPLPSDAADNILITGFPNFDSGTGEGNDLPPQLAQFLDDGPPPIVFTLGSFAVNAPGDFYRQSLAAARALGHRCVLLAQKDRRQPILGQMFAWLIIPHTQNSFHVHRVSFITAELAQQGKRLWLANPNSLCPSWVTSSTMPAGLWHLAWGINCRLKSTMLSVRKSICALCLMTKCC
jgi:rhamnosyltransferase subunit B